MQNNSYGFICIKKNYYTAVCLEQEDAYLKINSSCKWKEEPRVEECEDSEKREFAPPNIHVHIIMSLYKFCTEKKPTLKNYQNKLQTFEEKKYLISSILRSL